MNTFANIITRRSTRKYLDKEVSQELLEKIIEDMHQVEVIVKVIISSYSK